MGKLEGNLFERTGIVQERNEVDALVKYKIRLMVNYIKSLEHEITEVRIEKI